MQVRLNRIQMRWPLILTKPLINFKLGLAYLYSDTKSKAAAYIDKAYRLNPSVNPKIDYYLGIAFQNTNEVKKAIQHFEDFKKKNPNVASIAEAKIAECHIADSLAEYRAQCSY